jgi:RNA polymerase sigma-B factor
VGDRDEADTDLAAFRRHRSTGDRSIRNALVEANQGFAYYLAQQYVNRGIELDDLRQVAIIGLVKAVDRFDPDRGAPFATFARPFIVGEIRHFFRDTGWEVHVPRPVKEASQRVRAASESLRRRTGREPTPADVASETGLTVDEVLTALDAARVTRTRRLGVDGAASDGLEPRQLDPGFLDVERRQLLSELLDDLDERERQIIHARFVLEQSQSEIAEAIGVSQVHVSRLIRQILARLQRRLMDPDENGPA